MNLVLWLNSVVIFGRQHYVSGRYKQKKQNLDRQKITINRALLPDESVLKKDKGVYDYIDSFQGEFIDIKQNTGATDIGKAFFTSVPKWVEKLFASRNRIVRLFGLKTAGNTNNRQQQPDNLKCEPGERYGLFKVFDKTNNEIILGEDDKHLNFRVSLFLDKPLNNTDKKTLTISAAVKFNNWFGRLYFLAVRPFHKLIVPAMIKAIIRQLENEAIPNK